MKDPDDIFEKHEKAQSSGYYEDIRWKEVAELRKEGKDLLANGLVFSIRDDWGI
jgi:hypothetical protein